MRLKEKIKNKLNAGKYRRLLEYDFRTVIFTVVSLAITTGYAVFYAVLGIALFSAWYAMLACYYGMIAVMRAFVVFYHGGRRRHKTADRIKEEISRAKIYGNCGIIIILLTLPLSFTILFMVADKIAFTRIGLMIYASATYTFYKIVMTVRHIVKARKSKDMTVRAIRSINLADTLVSVLALQTAMFHSFSQGTDVSVFNALTGAGVCLAQVIIGAILVYNGKRAVTQIYYEENLKSLTAA